MVKKKSYKSYFRKYITLQVYLIILTYPQVIYNPHCHYQNFSPLANGLYFTVITNKTPLRNGNCPITDPITEMGVAHTVGLGRNVLATFD